MKKVPKVFSILQITFHDLNILSKIFKSIFFWCHNFSVTFQFDKKNLELVLKRFFNTQTFFKCYESLQFIINHNKITLVTKADGFSTKKGRNHIMNNSMRQADRVVNIPSLSASFNYNLQKIVAKWNKDDEGSNA